MKAIHLLFLISFAVSCSAPRTTSTYPGNLSPADTARANQSLTIGNLLYKSAKYDSSIVFYQEALPVFRVAGMTDQYVLCLDYLNVSYRSMAQFDRALAYCDTFLQVAQTTWGDSSAQAANAYSSTGVVYQVMGDFDHSLNYHLKALAIREALFGKESNAVGVSVSNLAVIYYLKGSYETSISFHERAIRIREKTLGPTNQGLASNWLNLGVVYRVKADYDKTLECYRKALTILKSTLGENHPRVARVYGNMAIVYDLLGDYDVSLEHHKEALRIREATLGPDHPDVANSLNDIGILQYNQDRFEEALEYLQRANAIWRQKLPDESNLIAQSFKNLGNACRKLGRPEEARSYFDQSLELSLRIYKEAHPELAMDYFSIGEVFADVDQLDSAESSYEKSLSLLHRCFGNCHPLISTVLRARASLADRRGQIEMALKLNHEAADALKSPVSDAQEIGVISEPDYLEVLVQRAELLVHRSSGSDLDSASQRYEEASRLMDQMRRSYRTEGSKLFWAGRSKSIVEKALRLEIRRFDATKDRKHLDKAFFWSEKSKAAILRDAITEARATEFSGLSDSVLQLEKQYRRDLTFYETQIQQVLEDPAPDRTRRTELEAGYFNLRNAYDRFALQLEKDNPRYFKLKYSSSVTALSDVQRLLDEESLWVEYFTGDSVWVCFVITKTSAAVWSMPRDFSLEQNVHRLRKALLELDFSSYLRNAVKLSESLVFPWKTNLTGKEHILIVPDGVLHHLPFDALFTEPVRIVNNPDFSRLPYLIRRADVSVLYSAEFLKDELNHAETGLGLLAVAPVFDDGSESRWNPLPNTAEEVSSIATLFKEHNQPAQILLRGQASENAFKKAGLLRYNVIHLASHGSVNAQHPSLSGVAFQSDSSSTDDGMLYAAEVYNLKLNADLVTLSSCESGFGTVARGEGLMGLARGFLYAGARRMLVSLWPVDDRVSAAMMRDFYRRNLAGMDYPAALRQTKLEMIKNKKTAYPADWSAFALIGK